MVHTNQYILNRQTDLLNQEKVGSARGTRPGAGGNAPGPCQPRLGTHGAEGRHLREEQPVKSPASDVPVVRVTPSDHGAGRNRSRKKARRAVRPGQLGGRHPIQRRPWNGPATRRGQARRVARALLRWEQRNLAEASGISLPSVKTLETEPGLLAAQERTIAELRHALEKAGVEFIAENGGRAGVRLAKKARPGCF
jgi:hypothetical protein